jgi:hypothetical protein
LLSWIIGAVIVLIVMPAVYLTLMFVTLRRP